MKEHWREQKGSNKASGHNNQTTPLWAYYQPILQALVESDGKAIRAELEPKIEALMKAEFYRETRIKCDMAGIDGN